MLANHEINYQKLPSTQHTSSEVQTQIVDFLHQELGRFRDPKEDIRACLEYIASPNHGGEIYTATKGTELLGVVLLTKTNMHRFVPDYLLVYIATAEAARGQGIGGKLLELVKGDVKAPIALHCEHDNPAMRLYNRSGFNSKYAEMRWFP